MHYLGWNDSRMIKKIFVLYNETVWKINSLMFKRFCHLPDQYCVVCNTEDKDLSSDF